MGADEKYTKVRQQLLKQLGINGENFKYGEVTIKKGIPASTLIKKMLNRSAKILTGQNKAKARERLLDIILKSEGMLDQLKETDIGKSQKFKEVCGELNNIHSGIKFLNTFVNDPYGEETQDNRKKLKKAIDEYFSEKKGNTSEQQDDANLVFLLLKELMAKDIERLDNETVYQHLPFDKEDAMQHANKFNIIIRRSDHPEEEVAKQLSSLTSLKTLKYYYIESEPKGDPDPKDLEVFKKTVTEIGNLYLKLLKKGTEEEKLEFTRYFVSIWCGDHREERRYEIVRIVNYFTSEDNKVLGEISNKLFSVDPLPEYNIGTSEGLHSLFTYYINNKLETCAKSLEKNLQQNYAMFEEQLEKDLEELLKDIKTTSPDDLSYLYDRIVYLYKSAASEKDDQKFVDDKMRVEINRIVIDFYNRHGLYSFLDDNDPYLKFLRDCYQKIKEIRKISYNFLQTTKADLHKFLDVYINIDNSGLVKDILYRSQDYLETIYYSQFIKDKENKIKKEYDEVTDCLESAKTYSGKKRPRLMF